MAQDTPQEQQQQQQNSASFSGVMAALARMRSEVAGAPPAAKRQRQEQGQVQGQEQVQGNHNVSPSPLSLPQRVAPPVGGGGAIARSSGDTLPPRVSRPSAPHSATKAPAPAPAPAQTEFTKVSNLPRVAPTRPASTIPTSHYKSSPQLKTNVQTFNQIQVSRSQTGNPLLEHLTFYQMNGKIKDVDYVINSKCVVLFLSLRYHKLHPEYIYNKLKKVTYNHPDTLRVLLLYVDVDDFQDTVRELNKLALFNSLTLVLGWTHEQCANYLQNLKAVEKEASKRIIQGSRTKDDEVLGNDAKFLERLVESLASINSVTQRDSQSLLAEYGSLRAVAGAPGEQLQTLSGLGATKVQRLLAAFHEPLAPADTA